jgi:hypothetical protein
MKLDSVKFIRGESFQVAYRLVLELGRGLQQEQPDLFSHRHSNEVSVFVQYWQHKSNASGFLKPMFKWAKITAYTHLLHSLARTLALTLSTLSGGPANHRDKIYCFFFFFYIIKTVSGLLGSNRFYGVENAPKAKKN